MLNEQVAGLLQNNAGNPAMVRRIAEENQLSQTEIAQALKIPEESAARYMPAVGERQIMNRVGQPSRQEEPAPIVQEPSMGGVKPGAMPQKPGAMPQKPGEMGVGPDFMDFYARQRQGDGAAVGSGAPVGGPASIAGAASAALGSAGSVGGGMGMTASPPGMTGIPAAPQVGSSGMNPEQGAGVESSGQMPSRAAAPVKPGSLGSLPSAPARLPADMKPQGLAGGREPMQEKPAARPGGVPSLPRIPRGGRFSGAEGEQAFVDAFNRLRGNVQ